MNSPAKCTPLEDYCKIQERLKDSAFRSSYHGSLINGIEEELQSIIERKSIGGIDLLNLLCTLRNLCIKCHANQNHLCKTTIPNHVISLLLNRDINLSDIVKTVGLQFIGNLITGNITSSKHVWPLLHPAFFEHFLITSKFCDKHVTIVSMILYNSLSDLSMVHKLLSNQVGKDIIVTLCDSIEKISDTDWISLLISDRFLQSNDFIPLVVLKCSISTLIEILQLYCIVMGDDSDSTSTPAIDNDFLGVYLCDLFTDQYCVCIETPSKDKADLLASIVAALCWATASPGHWNKNSVVSKAADNVVELLHNMNVHKNSVKHSTGFQLFAYLQNLMIKRDAVRLIGNICFENHIIQDRISMKGGIPLVLEACAIDDNHPFLQQWAIFAIHNLCQNNKKTQAEVAKLEKIGIADSPVLKSMGLTAVENENGKMCVKQLK